MKNKCVLALIGLLFSGIAIGFPEKEITFQNGSITLSGTLLLPDGEGPHPAVVFSHGSGTATRSISRPLAEKFAQIGLASLIFDKRGSGSSTGSWINSSLEDLALDSVAALDFLKQQKEIDSSRLGIWAISQSGWVAPVAASMSSNVSFMIVVSGGGVSPYETELFAYNSSLDHAGISPAEKTEAMALINKYFDYLQTGSGRDSLILAIEKSRSQKWYPQVRLDRILPSEENLKNWKWVATYEPTVDIEKIKFPILLFFGGKDYLQPSEKAAEKWRAALEKAGNKKVTIKVYPEANHGMVLGHHGPPGSETKYVPGYLETMLTWVQENVFP